MRQQVGSALFIVLVVLALLAGLLIYDQEQIFFIQHIELNRVVELAKEN